MRPAVNPVFRAPAVLMIACCLFGSFPSSAQEPASRELSPAVNHESGRVEQVFTAHDGAFQYRASLLNWRDAHVVVADSPELNSKAGDTRDFVVYRTEVNGRKVLRFEAAQSNSEEGNSLESSSTSAAITLGTANIDEIISAEVDGYRFIAYVLSWHKQRVVVVDARGDSPRTIGERLNFKVFHTGVGAGQRLVFSL